MPVDIRPFGDSTALRYLETKHGEVYGLSEIGIRRDRVTRARENIGDEMIDVDTLARRPLASHEAAAERRVERADMAIVRLLPLRKERAP